MRRGAYPPAQAVRILSGKVRNVDVRAQQALPADGEAAQPGAGGCGAGLREAAGRSGRRVHVSREGLGSGSHHGDIRHRTRPLQGPLGGGTARRGVREEVPALRGRAVYGPPALLHYRKERNLLRASLPETQQLEGEEPGSVRQFQPDERGRDIRRHHGGRAASAQVCRHVYHARTGGAPARPRGGAALRRVPRGRAGRHGHHSRHRRPH